MKRIKIFIIINIFIALGVLLVVFDTLKVKNGNYKSSNTSILQFLSKREMAKKISQKSNYNIWLIFTKIGIDSPLKLKFNNLIENLLNVSKVPLKFHVIIDDFSEKIAVAQLTFLSNNLKSKIDYFLYNINDISKRLQDIVTVFTPHFSSKPGTYYSDALFYISLGLHRIAPVDQDLAVMLDCDVYFKDDVALLFNEFDRFQPSALFGLAPELSPVYRHVLHKYRLMHNTTFGDYYNSKNVSTAVHPRGFQGYNSGIVLLNLQKIRESKTYASVLTQSFVTALVNKYMFKGHLGDQDFYTLLGCEYPDLIQTLNCGFNRQLCTWWKYHGYDDVFDDYFKCNHKIIVIHGNCNTKIPK